MTKNNSMELKGRYRRLYESFVFGKRICAVSRDAEMFFWRVYVIADDHGNFPANPRILMAKAGGLRDMTVAEVQKWTKELEEGGLLKLYKVGKDDFYGHFLSFEEYQPPTGAPRGGRSGRKRSCPESPWDDDISLPGKPGSATSAGGPVLLRDDAQRSLYKDNDKDKDNTKELKEKGRQDPDTVKGMDAETFIYKGFEYWQKKIGHPNAKLSPERVKALEARWKDSTFNEVLRAIDGCEASDFHMGRQPNNPSRFDDITLICRNRAKVEWFGDKVKTGKKQTIDDKKRRAEEARKRYHGDK